MQRVAVFLLVLMSALMGCNSRSANRQGEHDPDSKSSSVEKQNLVEEKADDASVMPIDSLAHARKELIETAKQIEGPFAAVVEDIVNAVDTDVHSLSVADSRINESGPGKHKFADETIAAYKKWRAAKISANKR